MTLTEMKALYKQANLAYYETTPIMSDGAFDKLEDAIKAKSPNWSELAKTGTTVLGKKVKATLLKPMPSLNKQYPEHIEKWIEAHPAKTYFVMEKLDGASLQIVYEKGKPVQAITRGDGKIGGDISFLIPHLNIPRSISTATTTVFRCEAIMTQANFAKWSHVFDNARNGVNGLLNRRDAHPALKNVDIVVLGIFNQTLLNGLVYAKSQKMKVVPYRMAAIDKQSLIRCLELRKANSDYAIDGLVVAPSDFKLDYANSDRPKNITAFKVNAEGDEVRATVTKIIWQVSGRGRIIPKIEINPIIINGAKITYCAAHNAEWMTEQGIGVGAIVRLVRSGDVIPKIVGVVKKAKPAVPDIDYIVKGVHYEVANNANASTTRTIAIKRIHKFMTTLGIELLAQKTIAKLYDCGATDVFAYTSAHNYFEQANLGTKTIANIEAELNRVLIQPIPFAKMMIASQVFGVGIGERKLAMIEKAGIRLSTLSANTDLLSVPGFGSESAKLIVDGMPAWKRFCHKISHLRLVDSTATKPISCKYKGMNFAWTGYRSLEEEAFIIANGGTVTSFNKKTSVLFYKSEGKASSKIAQAQANGVRVITFSNLGK